MSLKHLEVTNHGTIIAVQPLTQFASNWFKQNLDADVMMMGKAYMIEHRYWPDIKHGFDEELYFENKD